MREPLKIGILTTHPPGVFERSVEVVRERGHLAEVIEWKRVVATILDGDLTLGYQGRLGAGGLGDYDLVLNHLSGLRPSYHYEAFRAISRALVLNGWEAVALAADKMKTLIRARATGIRIPGTIALGNASFGVAIEEAERHLAYPMIMKEATADNGSEVYLVASRREAWERWNESDPRDLFLLQELLTGEHLRVVVAGDRVLYAVRNLLAPGDFRANARYHAGVELDSLSAAEDRIMIDVARALELDFVGFDVIRNEGELWLLEANAKPGLQGDAELLAGHGLDLYAEIGRFLAETAEAATGRRAPALVPVRKAQ